MKNIKIIHASDFHFDTPFRELTKEMAEKRKEELRETFGKIIYIAKEKNIEIMLLSGDIFDNFTVNIETLTFMKKKFQEIPEVLIFISPGNHDPYSIKSFYNIVEWPSNVYIFKERMDKVYIPKLNSCVYGVGFSTNYVKESLLKGFRVEDKSKINLMVLHGEVVKGNGISEYNPIHEEDIANSGLNYLGLGHVHSFSKINRSGNTFWAYPGCPEGRGFDELDEKGIIIGEVGIDHVNLEFLETCKRHYKILQVDITGAQNYEDISTMVNNAMNLDKLSNEIGSILKAASKDIYKLSLVGKIHRDFNISTAVLVEKLKHHFYFVKVENNTEILVDYETLANEFSLKGIFVRKTLERIKQSTNEEEKDKLKAALRLGLDALELREVSIE